jgi:hypothetical protein
MNEPLRALLIRRPWIDMILDGQKTWEIRDARTSVRGRISFIASRSGAVVGVCGRIDCIGPLTANQFRKNAKKAGMRPSEATLGYYRQTYRLTSLPAMVSPEAGARQICRTPR